MSVSANEPGQQSTDQAPGTEGNNEGHPAWQEILDAIPDSLHPLITPTLEKWDQGVKETLKDTRSLYDPYRDLVEQKVDPETIKAALQLVEAINDDPNAVANDLIEAFELDYVKKAAQEQLAQQRQAAGVTDPDDDDFLTGQPKFDVTKTPEFIAMQQTIESMQSKLTQEEQAKQAETAKAAHEEALKTLHTAPDGTTVEFDDMFVTALMAQGASGEEAVRQYHTIVNQAAAKIAQPNTQQTPSVPVVMGGDGTKGSGIPEGGAKMGDLKRGEVNDLVAQIIARQSEESG